MGLRGQIQGLRGQILSLRGLISGLRGGISGLIEQIPGLRGPVGTDGQTKVPLCSTGLRPLWGRCPKTNGKVLLREDVWNGRKVAKKSKGHDRRITGE